MYRVFAVVYRRLPGKQVILGMALLPRQIEKRVAANIMALRILSAIKGVTQPVIYEYWGFWTSKLNFEPMGYQVMTNT